MKTLYEKLLAYSQSDFYPFHMPGHKRKTLGFTDPYNIDITEIGGFDNLAHPRDVIKNINDRLAKLYGVKNARLLVNGSTGGNLTMIRAACPRNSRVLIARNCHKSVIHGALINTLSTDFIMPSVNEYGFQGQLDPEIVYKTMKEAYECGQKYSALIMTSPTYEGISSDIENISAICHEFGASLLVDSAHGAHMGISPEVFKGNPAKLGADCVTVSLHKTLPFFTQTSALLIPEESRIGIEEIEENIRIFQSSSPSYILMAGADRGLSYMEREGNEALAELEKNLEKFREDTRELKNLKIVTEPDMDPSKIVIYSEKAGFHGMDILKVLREKYHLELEMAAGDYALAMTSIMDTEKDLKRLFSALISLDRELDKNILDVGEFFPGKCLEKMPDKVMEMYEAMESEHEMINLSEAEGRVSAGEVCLYPPGIPDILAGERFDKEIIEFLRENIRLGHEVEGVFDGLVRVIK